MLEAGDEVERLRVAGCESGFESWPRGSVGAGVEGFAAGLGLGAKVVKLDVAENGGLDSGKREEEAGIEVCDGGSFSGLGARRFAAQVKLGFDLRESKGDGERVAVLSESVNPGTSGVAKAEEFGDFVIGFAGRVVDGAADEGVMPGTVGRTGEIEVRVAA